MLEEKAKELGRIIGQSNEYQAVKRANDALTADKEAMELMRQMETLRREAQRLIESGQEPTPEMERQLDSLLEQVQRNSVYQRMVAAQTNFEKIMARVNEWILQGIQKGATSSIITLG